MTILALDSSVSSDLKNDKVFFGNKPISPESCPQTSTMPRLYLRKRSYIERFEGEEYLPSVNSAFLSNLFADVAAVQNDTVCVSATPYQSQHSMHATLKSQEEVGLPTKRSKLDLKPMSRNTKSFKTLRREISHPCVSPDRANTTFFDISCAKQMMPLIHNDSLLFQLSCVTNSVSTDTSAPVESTAAPLIFPNLPNAISNSSCSTSLTRNVSDLQSNVLETSTEKESSYGWFVEMDDEDSVKAPKDPYAMSQVSELAFCAPTAPKASNYDAELEWAKAADTVDDVLGDFF